MPIYRLLAFLIVLVGVFGSRAALAEALPYADGVLWRVELAEGLPSHVFGTVHSSDERITALPPSVAEIFDHAERIAIEVLVDTPAVLRLSQAMLLPSGERLDALLTQTQLARLEAAAARFKMPMGMVTRFKPWGAMLLFSVPPEEHLRTAAGLKPLDESLRARAEAAGKPVSGLETIDEQIATLDGMTREDQLAMLDLTLAQAPEIERIFAALRDAYLARNLAAVYDVLQAADGADPTGAVARCQQRLVVERNRRMVERMASLLREGGAFVAVGALHLPGEEGILKLLAKQGYTVTRVY
jgi:hypothetical protein